MSGLSGESPWQWFFAKIAMIMMMITFRPSIWLIAADSFKVHSSMTFCLISFMNNMKAFNGFLMYGRRCNCRLVVDSLMTSPFDRNLLRTKTRRKWDGWKNTADMDTQRTPNFTGKSWLLERGNRSIIEKIILNSNHQIKSQFSIQIKRMHKCVSVWCESEYRSLFIPRTGSYAYGRPRVTRSFGLIVTYFLVLRDDALFSFSSFLSVFPLPIDASFKIMR